jgi:D-alanine-D-alanine ligase
LGGGEDFILNAGDPKNIRLSGEGVPVALVPESGGLLSALDGSAGRRIDVAVPILHGPFGEDGTIQGLLKLGGLPFVGAGVLGSAVGMDKAVMKRLLLEAGLPIGKFLVVRSCERLPDFRRVTAMLGLPLFVKPANMGSSVGVSKVHSEAEFEEAIRLAFSWDTKAVVEEFIPGRELECSVLGNEKPRASLPGEVVSRCEFYSYEAKYLDEDGAALEIPAKLPPEKIREIQDLAVRTFRALECEGLGRVDFFLRPDGAFVVNEINTMPGFTKISMYPKLWDASGLSYSSLIDELITLAIRRFEREKALQTSYLGGEFS